MKKLTTLITFLFIILISTNAVSQEKPNVIVIMADDLGYADVSFNGSTEIPTPNIDRIADNGVKFTSAYTTYSVCGPSRAGFITGRYQQRFGFERNPLYRVDDPYMGLPHNEMTIPESVSQVGYKSGVIGKWHLGAHISNHPLNRGFTEFYGHLGGGHRYFPEELTIEDSYAATSESQSYKTWIMRNHTPEQTDEYLTDEFSNEAVNFVEKYKEKPFFLFLSYNAPHAPLQATEADLAQFPNLSGNRKTYAAMVHAVDRGVGRVLDKLEELEIDENTIVFFLSDNGGPESKNASDNGILRGGKSDVYEGGYRVPFAMQWKGKIAGGGVFDKPVSSLDIFATLSALSGSPTNPEKPLDGVNLIPFLNGENEGMPHETIHIRKFDQDRHAVRLGDYKYIRFLADNPNPKLYNLSTNISESDSENLYWKEEFRPKRDELIALVEEWEKDLLHPHFPGLMHDDLVWATGVTISETNLELTIDDTHQMTASAVPNDAFTNVIEWSSNNPSVATVDENGLISAKAEGYTIITARVVDRRDVFSQCIVKVGNPVAATDITLSDDQISVTVGETAELSATILPSENNSYALEWSSSNESVATIDVNGKIITHKTGVSTITAKVVGNESVTATCSLLSTAYVAPTAIFKKKKLNDELVSVYPNPVKDVLTIDLKSFSTDINFNIVNALGEKAYTFSRKANENSLQIQLPKHIENGVYFLFVKSGGKSATSRFVLAR